MMEFNEVKRIYDTIARAIGHAQEPMQELSTVRHFLADLCADGGAALVPKAADAEEQSKGFTSDQLRYILEDFSPGLIKKMLRERSQDDQYLEVCGGVLEGFLNLLLVELRRGHFNIDFLMACRHVFDYDCFLHKFNFQIPDEALQRLFTKGSGQSWRKDLKEGDPVDALLHHCDRTGSSRGAGWSQAKIGRVDEDALYLEYLTEPKEADRSLDRWSVEIAPFESKTKEIYEWKKTLRVDDQVDVQDDTFKWLKATIIKLEEEEEDGRVIPMARVGLRIYLPTGQRSDERGNYDGWSDRFDETISIYSPRICKFMTQSVKSSQDDDDLDESLDDVMKPEEGQSRVWAVPRPRRCSSREYVRHMNSFCHQGGLDTILKVIESCETTDQKDGYNLRVMAILLSGISLPAAVYHKSVVTEFAPKLIEASKKRLLQAPDKALRDVRREHIEAIVKAVDNLSKRLIEKVEREKQSEILKLEVALLCLNSSFMERRIQGIRDLNQIIKGNRIYSGRFSGKFLVEWMQTKGVFDILFDQRRSHLQLVQRCDEVLKLLLQEDMLSLELLQQFWSLTKTDLRLEVYKIIQDCSFYFKQKHLDFIFDKIKNDIPTEKLDMEEFSTLSELGKYSKDKDSGFQERVAEFFWDLIVSSSSKNLELIESCIQKYRDMVRYWALEKKQDMFLRLLKCLSEPDTPSLPCLKLLQGLIKDQSERTQYMTATSTYPSQSGAGAGYGGGAGGSALRTKTTAQTTNNATQNSTEDGAGAEKPVVKKELSLQGILSSLLSEHGLVDHLLAELACYCKNAIEHVEQLNLDNEGAGSLQDRRKMHVRGGLQSHHEEIDERLQFLKFIAQVSNDYCISKKELGVIYDLLVTKSCIESDQQEFLIWCKSSCESQTSSKTSAILDLTEVGEFFTEKIACKELDVKNLDPVGFEFLQFYFISLNEKEGNLERHVQQNQGQKTSYPSYTNQTGRWSTSYSYNNQNTHNNRNEDSSKIGSPPRFTLQKLPSELKQQDMLWTLVLECERPDVVPHVIDFLIKVHLSLKEELKSSRLAVLQGLIDRCMSILQSEQGKDAHRQARAIEILKNLVHETEVKGTGDVTPHGALLKGESLDPLSVKNRANHNGGELMVQVYSNTTLWDLRKEVAIVLDLAPRLVQLHLGTGTNGTELKDVDNGKTMKALGLTGGETLTAQLRQIDEHVPQAALLAPDGSLTPGAIRIFSEWYDMYCDAEGKFTRESAARFIQGCCGDLPAQNDNRISSLVPAHDGQKEASITKDEFLVFYKGCSRSEKSRAVRENLAAFNVRPDLKKWSEVEEQAAAALEELPRYFIPTDQVHFDLLMSLLDGEDQQVAEEAWELVQMLATNSNFYGQVLKLDIAKKGDSASVDWTQFFDRSSSYKLLYTLQIVQAVLEDGETDTSRCSVLNCDDFPTFKVSGRPPQRVEEEKQNNLPKDEESNGALKLKKRSSTIAKSAQEDAQLRAHWTEEFLNHGGFQHILKDFMACSVPEMSSSANNSKIDSKSFELKYLAFMLHLLRTFIMAAFSMNDSAAYKVAALARRSSAGKDIEREDSQQSVTFEEGSSFQQLQKLMEGPMGLEIIESVDYSVLQRKLLSVTSQVLKKQKLIFEDKLIVDNALNLWVGCLLHSDDLFNEFLESKDLDVKSDEFLLTGLLYCPYETVREEFRQSLGALCRKPGEQQPKDKPSPLDFVLQLLSTNFSLISDYYSKQYFALFIELLDHQFLEAKTSKAGAKGRAIDSEALLSVVIDRIREENQKAQTARAEGQGAGKSAIDLKESAGLFLSLIQLAGKILDNCQDQKDGAAGSAEESRSGQQQRGLVDEIFTRFLFPSVFNQDDNEKSSKLTMSQVMESKLQKKQTSFGVESKGAAYRLLNSLLRRDRQLMDYFLRQCMKPLMSYIERTDGWNYTPPSASERHQDYVGIRNLGCICYLNSMLQQFFMIPAFRYNLLCVDDGVADDMQVYKGDLVDDNMLHQLQKLMSNLELSARNDYNPWEFCFAFKEFDGSPTNTLEQKDAQEFLNLAFDRIETALRGTSQKHLLQSVFGGKTCSQLVCSECGKVKNRLEDFYNLSLTVKDIKGVHESLQKLVEGEVINDYECSGCKRKVDVSKRTLISQTPNVLIVHLQRIIFNFDKFTNDKINQHFEFPQVLDLKPYSYYEIMGKENRLKKKQSEGDEDEDREAEDKDADKNEDADEENQEPAEEDCFEYKLRGVNVHSGTAHQGHYWSLINTSGEKQETAEADDEEEWGSTKNDRWMEFNDSTVKDFNLAKLKEECYGGDNAGGGGFGLSSLDGWGFGGGYGKSGYMLFYERRKKKPLKVLVEEEKEAAPEQEESKDQKKEEKKEEQLIEVDYHQAVSANDKPSRIFKQVMEDNRKYGFENDVYSADFFDFVLGIQKSVAAVEGDDPAVQTLRRLAIDVGSKSTLEVLAKALQNTCIEDHMSVFLELMSKDSGSFPREFLESWYHKDGFDYLFSLILECTDQRARQQAAMLLRYVLVTLKMQEQDYLMEMEDYEVEGEDGEKVKMQRHRSLCARFVVKSIQLLNSKVAKNWQRFDQFHDLLFAIALADVVDVQPQLKGQQQAQDNEPARRNHLYDCNSPAARVGLEFFFKLKFVEKACDFMLGRKSPLCGKDEKRPELGGSYTQPDFSGIIRLMTNMITDEALLAKYPMADIEKEMILHDDLLKTMLGSATASKQFGQCLANMCRDNVKLTQRVSQVFLRSIEAAHQDTVKGYLKALKPFLRSDDSLKKQKLEWVFGVPELVSRKYQYGDIRTKYGLELVDRINDDSMMFRSPILHGAGDEALITQITKCRDRFDLQCISCLKELLSLMRKDQTIAYFFYHLPSYTYQCARFTDWFRPYLSEQLADSQRQSLANSAFLRNRHELIQKAIAHLDAVEPVFAEFEKAQLEKLDKCLAGGEEFTDLKESWVGAQSAEVIRSYPPQLIVGKSIGDEREVYVYDEDPLVRVQIFELDCEYAYSAPTGRFNLQVPHIEVKTNMYQTMSYEHYKREQAATAAKQENADLEAEAEEQRQTGEQDAQNQVPSSDGPSEVAEAQQTPKIVAADWEETKKQGAILLKVLLTNKSEEHDLKVLYRLTPGAQGEAGLNVVLPVSMKEIFLNTKVSKVIELLVKVDPSQPYFCKKIEDIKVELESTVRNTSAGLQGRGQRRVSYEIHHNASIGTGTMSNQDIDDDRDDDTHAYDQYQASPHYNGYDGAAHEEDMLKLDLNRQQSAEDADGDRQSNESTQAVQLGNNAGVSRQNSADDLDFANGEGCESCPSQRAEGAWQCCACGVYLGGGQ